MVRSWELRLYNLADDLGYDGETTLQETRDEKPIELDENPDNSEESYGCSKNGSKPLDTGP